MWEIKICSLLPKKETLQCRREILLRVCKKIGELISPLITLFKTVSWTYIFSHLPNQNHVRNLLQHEPWGAGIWINWAQVVDLVRARPQKGNWPPQGPWAILPLGHNTRAPETRRMRPEIMLDVSAAPNLAIGEQVCGFDSPRRHLPFAFNLTIMKIVSLLRPIIVHCSWITLTEITRRVAACSDRMSIVLSPPKI